MTLRTLLNPESLAANFCVPRRGRLELVLAGLVDLDADLVLGVGDGGGVGLVALVGAIAVLAVRLDLDGGRDALSGLDRAADRELLVLLDRRRAGRLAERRLDLDGDHVAVLGGVGRVARPLEAVVHGLQRHDRDRVGARGVRPRGGGHLEEDLVRAGLRRRLGDVDPETRDGRAVAHERAVERDALPVGDDLALRTDRPRGRRRRRQRGRCQHGGQYDDGRGRDHEPCHPGLHPPCLHVPLLA